MKLNRDIPWNEGCRGLLTELNGHSIAGDGDTGVAAPFD